MAKQRKFDIAWCLLATALLYASETQAGFAAQGGKPGDHHAGSRRLSVVGQHSSSPNRGTRRNNGKTVVRNVIGQRLAPQSGLQKNGTSPGLHTSPQFPPVAVTGTSRQGPPNGVLGTPGVVRLNPGPTGAPRSRGSIGGTVLIRPGVTSHGIGGPTKMAVGINGTMFKNKR